MTKTFTISLCWPTWFSHVTSVVLTAGVMFSLQDHFNSIIFHQNAVIQMLMYPRLPYHFTKGPFTIRLIDTSPTLPTPPPPPPPQAPPPPVSRPPSPEPVAYVDKDVTMEPIPQLPSLAPHQPVTDVLCILLLALASICLTHRKKKYESSWDGMPLVWTTMISAECIPTYGWIM